MDSTELAESRLDKLFDGTLTKDEETAMSIESSLGAAEYLVALIYELGLDRGEICHAVADVRENLKELGLIDRYSKSNNKLSTQNAPSPEDKVWKTSRILEIQI